MTMAYSGIYILPTIHHGIIPIGRGIFHYVADGAAGILDIMIGGIITITIIIIILGGIGIIMVTL